MYQRFSMESHGISFRGRVLTLLWGLGGMAETPDTVTLKNGCKNKK